MSYQGKVGRIVAIAGLTGALTLAGSIGAEASSKSHPTGARRWLEDVLHEGFGGLLQGWFPLHASASPRTMDKDSPCPASGCPPPQSSGNNPQPNNQQGVGIDPDGKP